MRARVASLALAAFLASAPPARAQNADADPWLARDKAMHFDVSAGLAAVGYGTGAGWLFDARWKALAFGGGIALGAGATKELLDWSGVIHGTPSWKDFTWDVVGTVAGLAIAWGVDLLLGGVSAQHPALAAP